MKYGYMLLCVMLVLSMASFSYADDWDYEIILKNCYSEDEVVIPETVSGIPVKVIGDFCFAGSETLDELVIPEYIDTIGEYAFTESTLSSVEFQAQTFKSIGTGAFSLTDLERIVLPRRVDYLGEELFRECFELVEVTLPDIAIYELPAYTFFECDGLKTLFLPDSIEKIGDSALYYCASLTDVHIPEKLVTIEESAFESCVSLESIRLPVGVRWIGENAFLDCESLKTCYLPETVEYIGPDAFDGCESLCLEVHSDSYALRYAEEYGIDYKIVEAASK